MIPEAVLGTKEPSEKARLAAFDLVVAMGRKMAEGGVVKRSLVDGMDEDDGEGKTAEGMMLSCAYVVLERDRFPFYSQSEHRRVLDHGSWRPGGCHTAHDQRDGHRDLAAGLRVQRSASPLSSSHRTPTHI